MLQVEIVPALSDNYVYLITDTSSGSIAILDPADATIVLDALNDRLGKVAAILNTHHHYDHVAGNLELKARTGAQIYGPKAEMSRIEGVDKGLVEGDRFHLGDESAQIIETPGHTSGHIAFWFDKANALFCGDTLFALGCGRMFEGTAGQMWSSLAKLKSIPDSTRIYCGHEYTQSNARFALSIDQNNQALKTRAAQVDQVRAAGQPTIPTTMGLERITNPFLRVADRDIRKRLGMEQAEDTEVFGELRRLKDSF